MAVARQEYAADVESRFESFTILFELVKALIHTSDCYIGVREHANSASRHSRQASIESEYSRDLD